jgi:hypothetical protein
VSAQAPPTGPTATASPTATPGPPSDRTIRTKAGSVVAQCRGDLAYLVGWSPAPGYKAGGVRRGPAATAKLEFEGHERKLRVSVVCADGVVLPTITEEEESEEEHPEPTESPDS